MCKGVAVMRRRADSWLNATQILKVAGFDKPQRTRVLEREVQKGEQGFFDNVDCVCIVRLHTIHIVATFHAEVAILIVGNRSPITIGSTLVPRV